MGTSAERTALASLRLIRGKGIRMLPYTTSMQPLEHNRVIELRTGIVPPQQLHALQLIDTTWRRLVRGLYGSYDLKNVGLYLI